MFEKLIKLTTGTLIAGLMGAPVFAKNKGSWISWEDEQGNVRHGKILSVKVTGPGVPSDQRQSSEGVVEPVRENPGFLLPQDSQEQYFDLIRQKIDEANQDRLQASLNDDGSVTLFSPSTPGRSYLAPRRFHEKSNLDALCLSYGFGLSLGGSLKTHGVSRANGYKMDVNLMAPDGTINVVEASRFNYIERLDCSGKITPPVSHRYEETVEKSGHTIIKKPKFLIHNQEYYFDSKETHPEAICKLYGFQSFHELGEYKNTIWNFGGLYYQLFRKTARLYENAQFKNISAGSGVKWIECS